MGSNINIKDVYDKNLNFLVGSGASAGLLPTLGLKIADENGEKITIETLATLFEQGGKNELKALLFMHYYQECIKPALNLNAEALNNQQLQVLSSYENFLDTILQVLDRRDSWDQKCNLFTTNYDGCFEFSVDTMLSKNRHNFILNDGAQGFRTRYLNAKNFNTYAYQTGVFDQHRASIPQINLIHLHGSIFWRKHEKDIVIDYARNGDFNLLPEELFAENLGDFSTVINDQNSTTTDLNDFTLENDVAENFWGAYKKLPIVNPTKWKFHETVFEEHYYQMLRLLSYELEKPNSVLITFGFSFADEHILRLVQRSLSNPKLQVFVCCFSESGRVFMESVFQEYNNVELIHIDGNLDFIKFNELVFTLVEETENTDVGIE